MAKGCVVTMTQGDIFKVYVSEQLVSGCKLLTAMLDLDNILHYCFP